MAKKYTADNFIINGGLSSQFLKADGSVDSNTYATLNSPSFTGTPTAPTATAGTNTTQVATTAFVQTENSNNVKLIGVSNQTIQSDIVIDGTLSVTSPVTADAFSTNGGNSTQVVKGDGSLSVGYKVYTALLSQTGTNAPVATVLENTLGGTVVWGYISPGMYSATLTGAFTASKTVAFINGDIDADETYGIKRVDANQVFVISRSFGITGNGILQEATVEIRVYN